MPFWIVIIFLLCLSPAGQSLAQPSTKYIFHHLDHQNGLLADDIRSIEQDDKGYIWISSKDYLQRYDGLRFRSYPGYDGYEKIRFFCRDYDNYTDPKNQTWLLGSSYKYYFDSLTTKKPGNAAIIRPDKVSEEAVIAEDKSGQETWVATAYELLLIDDKTKKIYSHDQNPFHNSLLRQFNRGNLRSMMMDSRKNIWITAWSDSFYRYNPATEKLAQYSLSALTKSKDRSLDVSFIFEDNHGVVWLGTQKAGLMKYHPDSDTFDFILSDEKDNETIQYNYEIYCMFQDREENLWVGTDKGISIFNPYRQYFSIIRNVPGNASSLPRNEIMAVIETRQGDLLTGTWGGGFTLYDNNFQFKKTFFFNNGIPEENLTWSFVEYNDTTIWIGCQHGYLHIYNTTTRSVSTLHPPEFRNSTIICMIKDATGNIWFGLHNGQIAEWDEKQKQFYSYNATMSPDQVRYPISNMLIDRQQNFWVATEKGFKRFDPQKRIFSKVYLTNQNIPFSIPDERCRSVEEFNDDSLLIGTAAGLNFFNKKTEKFTSVTSKRNFSLNAVHAIKNTGNNIWFTTDYNLYIYNPVLQKFIACNIENGMMRSPFSADHFYITHDGRWITFTSTEMITFFPDSLKKEISFQPGVTITGVSVFDQPVAIDLLVKNKKPLRLSYKQNFLNIEFSALRFSNFGQTNYSYQLKGIDKNWVQAGAKQFAAYTKLDPGQYTFLVKADSGEGEEKITSFDIIIDPPFWKTAWFIMLCAAIVIWFFYSAVKWRIRFIRKEAASKLHFSKQIAEMEITALRAQMNPHFIFNCINSIDAMIQSNDKYHATTYLNKFAKLLRNVLDSSKENTVSLAKDLETLELYIQLEQFRNENRFTYEIKIEAGLLDYDIRVPPLVIQPYVENAIQHGLRYRNDNFGKLLVTICRQNGQIFYIVEDNGIGRDSSTKFRNGEKRSYGMDMSDDRIKLFNKEDKTSVEITDLLENGNPAGTRVTAGLKID